MSAELRRRIVRRGGFRAAVAAYIVAVACAGSTRADDRAAASKGSVQAKLSYCKDCHGPSAQGYHGFYPIPRLAGQQPEYLENQLRAFTEHRRPNNNMFNVAHALSPGMETGLAEHFRNLNPKPAADGPRQLVAEGKRIFEDGAPDSEYCGLRGLSRPGGHGRPTNPSAGGSTLSLSRQGADRLGKGARPECRKAGHIGRHDSDRTQLVEGASRSRCSLCQSAEVTA